MHLGEVTAALASCVILSPSALASASASRSQSSSPPSDATSHTEADSDALASMDRPGLANVTQTAPLHSLVTEQTLQVALPGEQVEVVTPLVLVRFALLSWLELRTQLPSSVVRFPEDASSEVLVDDWRFGVAAAADLSSNVSASLVPTLAVPLGSPDAGAAGVDASLQANLSWSVAPKLELVFAAQGGWQHVERGAGRVAMFRGMGGALVDFRLFPQLMCFVQSYAQYVHSTSVEPVLGGGLAWWVTPGLQLHAEASSILSDDSPPASLSVGAGVQWW